MTSRANATFSRDRLVGEQPEVLEDRAELAAQLRDLPVGQAVQVLAEDVDHAGVGTLLPQHQPEEGRLAGAGRAHQEDELALLDLERDVPQGGAVLLRVELGDAVESDHVGTRVAGYGKSRVSIGLGGCGGDTTRMGAGRAVAGGGWWPGPQVICGQTRHWPRTPQDPVAASGPDAGRGRACGGLAAGAGKDFAGRVPGRAAAGSGPLRARVRGLGEPRRRNLAQWKVDVRCTSSRGCTRE